MLDPQLKKILELYDSLNFPPFTSETQVEEVRALMTQFSNNPLKKLQQSESRIQDFICKTPLSEIHIRGYYPENKSMLAPLLFFRGSGFVVNNFDDSDDFCIRLAKGSQRLVLSVDYPLAPEYPFPDSLKACYEVYLWAREHAEFADTDPDEMILIGESSGGCLVALLASYLREQNVPIFKKQVLLYPILGNSFEGASFQKYAKGYILTLAKLKWYLNQYLKENQSSEPIPAFPLQEECLEGFPQTLIYNAEYDPLCDDGIEYAKRLEKASVDCLVQTHAGMIHGFLKFKGLKRPDEIFNQLCERLSGKTNFLPVSNSSPLL